MLVLKKIVGTNSNYLEIDKEKAYDYRVVVYDTERSETKTVIVGGKSILGVVGKSFLSEHLYLVVIDGVLWKFIDFTCKLFHI